MQTVETRVFPNIAGFFVSVQAFDPSPLSQGGELSRSETWGRSTPKINQFNPTFRRDTQAANGGRL
jgi:hypothetical protein